MVRQRTKIAPGLMISAIGDGANFAAVKGVNNQVVSNETCVVCHIAGAIADVQVVHNLAAYQ